MLKLKNNLVGQKFGKLSVLEFSHKDKKSQAYYLCVCECGNKKVVRGSHLTAGNVTSCGCARKDRKYERVNDLTGQRFGKLTVLSYVYSDKHRFSHYLCQCDCGNKKVIVAGSLINGKTKSCGCLRYDNIKPRKKQVVSRLYKIWDNIKYRCNNPNCKFYNRYGGRGITICDEWLHDFKAFEKWALNNGYNSTLTIDRIDNSKGYYPENCRFADKRTQSNNRSNNHYITIDNVTKTLTEWLRIYPISENSFRRRVSKGWSEYDAITIPPKH